MASRTALEEVARYRHGRVPRAVRERQVLELAEELFAERGFEAASMDELARRAGVSKPIIYGLVGSKEELFRRSFQRAADELAAAVTEAAVGSEAGIEPLLRNTAIAFFRFVGEHRGAWAMLFAEEGGGRLAPYVDEIRAQQAQFTARLLRERAASVGGDLGRQEAEATAYGLNGIYEALAHWWRSHPEVEPETLAEWLVRLATPGLLSLTGKTRR